MPIAPDPSAPPRRSFIQRLAAISAILAGAAPATVFAAQGKAPSDPWLAKVTAKHRQVFDAPEVNGGFPTVFAATYLRTMTETYHLPAGGAHAVVVLRHSAMPMALTDDVWDRYAIGAMLNVTDPATKAPARRNIFWKSREGDIPFPQASIEKVLQMPVTFVACGAALAVLSGRAAAKAGVDAATAKREWEAGIIPGISIVPSGVLAVARAQEHGCSYCYAG
ncbi:MAG TPA: hypothetical protein VFV33_03465 [Gemmatimonadaceae bacterium]|nr:hypothetical protein [Gemmatimonadaceae bacterium]